MPRTVHGRPGVYNATPITLTDGEGAALALDSAGNVKTAPSGNVASGATDSGNPVKVGGRYNSSSPTLTNGQRGDLQLDSKGNLKVTQECSFTFISGAATTVVKSGAGFLHSITVGGGNAFAMNVYDNIAGSGPAIAQFGTFATTDRPSSYVFDLAFTTGLTVVTDGSCRVTVTYR